MHADKHRFFDPICALRFGGICVPFPVQVGRALLCLSIDEVAQILFELWNLDRLIPVSEDATLCIQQEELRGDAEAQFLLKLKRILVVDVDARESDLLAELAFQPMHHGHDFTAGNSQRRVELYQLQLFKEHAGG